MAGVLMEEMGAMDCPICHEPLGPVIYQCGMGHLLCRSCYVFKNFKTCPSPLCARTTFTRCFGMERIAKAIKVPCCFAKNGCTEKMAYFNKAKHEKACQHGPCFCPEPGCGFTGPVVALRDHFAGHHKWPSTAFEYYQQFDLRLQQGRHVLYAQDGTSVFLMSVAPAVEPRGHAICLVCVQPQVSTDSKKSKFGLSLMFSCFTGSHQVFTMEDVRSSSLADGLPKDDVLCVVPKASGDDNAAMLRITIDTELTFDDAKLEDDDTSQDENYDEDKDDEDDEEEADDEDDGEEDDEDDGEEDDEDDDEEDDEDEADNESDDH